MRNTLITFVMRNTLIKDRGQNMCADGGPFVFGVCVWGARPESSQPTPLSRSIRL